MEPSSRKGGGSRGGKHPHAEAPDGRAARGYTHRMIRLAALLAAALLVTPGCKRSSGPAETYRAFAAAARSRDPDAENVVWNLLSARSREALDARAKEVAARAPPGTVPASGRELVLGNLSLRAARVRSAVVLRESRDAAVVAVEEEGRSGAREVSLVREAGVWRVVLPFDN